MTGLLVMLGAALGSACRWWLDAAVQSRHQRSFPYGTLVINVSGSLVLGVLLGAMAHGGGSAQLLAFAGTGFCGGYTTFSAFTFETVRLGQEGRYGDAALNVVSSLGVGLVAALAGWYLALALWG